MDRLEETGYDEDKGKKYAQKMFSILGSPQDYRANPTLNDPPIDGWFADPLQKGWFGPHVKGLHEHPPYGLVGGVGNLLWFMGIILGFCIGAVVAVLILIGSWNLLRVWLTKRYEAAQEMSTRALERLSQPMTARSPEVENGKIVIDSASGEASTSATRGAPSPLPRHSSSTQDVTANV